MPEKKNKYSIRIKDLPLPERPRERLINFGARALSNAELLARMEFSFFTLKNRLIEVIEERAGTALPYIRVSDIENKESPIPPSPILQSFRSIVEPLFQKIILNQKQIMTLRKIRDTLLPLLVFGKLRIVET